MKRMTAHPFSKVPPTTIPMSAPAMMPRVTSLLVFTANTTLTESYIRQTSPGQSLLCSSRAVEEASATYLPALTTLLTLGPGKTSFLRLLLDTSSISPATTKDQLASVAKFVQGCSGHTAYIRTASVDVDVDIEGTGGLQQLGLTLIDTPSLDFKDETTADRLISDTLRHIDSRFVEGVEHNVSACCLSGFPFSVLMYPRLGLEGAQR
jgi:hypothetical protein